MTDREMLLLAYGALMAMKNSNPYLVALIKDHLYEDKKHVVYRAFDRAYKAAEANQALRKLGVSAGIQISRNRPKGGGK